MFKRIFSSSHKKENNSNKVTVNEPLPVSNVTVMNEQKRKKLLRRLALAENDPEPLLDLSESDLNKLEEQILLLIKVYHKRRIHLERNQLSSIVIPRSLKQLSDITVLHLSENHLCTFQLESFHSLTNLKELYLNQNLLTSLPLELFNLPNLCVLSVRENQLALFPIYIQRLPSLTYCDLAYNRIEILPREILSIDNRLQTLILEGNPLQFPTYQYLIDTLTDEHVTNFAQIDSTLRSYYQNSFNDENDSSKKNGSKSRQIEFDYKCKVLPQTLMTKPTAPEDDDQVEDHFTRYEQRKLASKREAIEWERNYMKTQLGHHEAAVDDLARVACKDKLLQRMHHEQSSLMAKIDQFQSRKDVEKQKILDDCIAKLQEHSSLLIEKLSNDKTLDLNGNQNQLGDELNEDICQLLSQYDVKLKLKRDIIRDQLIENHHENSVKLAQSYRRKEDQHQSLFRQLEIQDESLTNAFDAIQSARVRRNEDLSEKISIVEQQLLALTFVERERKTERNDQLLADLVQQRTQLAQLLASLLEVKRFREKQLMETLESELSKRYGQHQLDGDQSATNWLEDFQKLLSKESFVVQVAQYGIDIRIADLLVGIYNQLEDDTNSSNGSMLQGKLAYYLGHFVDMPIDRFCNSTPDDLMKLHIDDYELCQVIVEHVRLNTKLSSINSQTNIANEEEGTIPSQTTLDQIEAPEVNQSNHSEADIGSKFWCEAECVICLDNKSNIVFLPCGHVCTCQRCIRPNACPVSLCPLCRADIEFMQSINVQ